MRRRILEWLAIFLFRRAWFMLPLLLASVFGAAWVTRERLIFDTSLIAFLPPRSEDEMKIREIVRDYRNLEPVMVVIRSRQSGQEELLRNIVRVFADEWLDDRSYFHKPVYRTDEIVEDYYRSLPDSRLIQLLTPADWEELEQLLRGQLAQDLIRKRAYRINAFMPRQMKRAAEGDDPLGALASIRNRLAHSRGPTRLLTRGGYFLSNDGRSIAMLLYPVLSTEDARNADRTLRFLERSRDSLFERYGAWRNLITIEFSGSVVDTARNINDVREDFRTIATITVPLLALLLLLVFRKLEAVVFVLLPPIVGAVWTLGLATLLFGGISAVTAVFIAVVGALGLQFAIHLYHRFTLELYRTRFYYRALRHSYVETARGIFSSAIALAIIFFSLFVGSTWGSYNIGDWVRSARDAQGLGQLGLVVGICILCNLAAALVTLPLLAAVKHWLARGRVKPVLLYRFGIERLYEPAIHRPQATILVMLLMAVIGGFYSRQLSFHPRFASVSSFFYKEVAHQEDPEAAFPRTGRPLIAIVEGRSLQAAVALQSALEANDQLYANLRAVAERYDIRAIDSLRSVLPSIRSQDASLSRLAAMDLDGLRADLAAMASRLGFRTDVYERFIDALRSFQAAAREPRYILFSSAESGQLIETAMLYITSRPADDGAISYHVRTAIYPGPEGFDPAQFDQLRTELEQGIDGLVLVGDPVIERQMEEMLKVNLAAVILLSIVMVLGMLVIHFRGTRLAWLTFLPIVVEALWMCGLMAVTGLRIHFFTVLAMPLVLGLAADNALQLTQYYFDRQRNSVRHAMQSVGRVIPLTCAAMAILYGTLCLMSYPGFRDFGLTVLLGSATVVIGTLMLLPALLQILGRDQPLREALSLGTETEI